jgi:hypothetical protein
VSQAHRNLTQLLGNFKETLEDCRRFLEEHSEYGDHHSVIRNFTWFIGVEDEAIALRDRIVFLNIKVSSIIGLGIWLTV